MSARRLDPRPLLSPAEVASMLDVPTSTVLAWSKGGALRSVFTASGRRMFLKADIFALHPELNENPAPPTDATSDSGPARQRLPHGSATQRDAAEAAAVVAEAVEIAAEADAARALEALTLVTAEAAGAAGRAATAALQAKASRAFAAKVAAEAVASAAEHAASVERARAHAATVRANAAAQQASQIVVDSFSAPHTRAEAARTAQGVAAVVQAELDARVRDDEAAAAAIELAYDHQAEVVSEVIETTTVSTAAKVDAVTRHSEIIRARAARRARSAIAVSAAHPRV